MIIHDNNMAALACMADGAVDAILTDPPYGLSFMGQRWDYDVPSEAFWRECLRVLKPGGHLLAFAGTRTQHRMAVRIEDAGFEIRDMIAWVYGSGFPKSHNLLNGQGTALKPALEPITLARKPLQRKYTVAKNVETWGTGALNVNLCRVVSAEGRAGSAGRWPANLIHDGSDEVMAAFPTGVGAQSPQTIRKPSKFRRTYGKFRGSTETNDSFHGDGKGSAARFFYCAKASRGEREAGLEDLNARQRVFNGQSGHSAGLAPGSVEARFTTTPSKNDHPTVKPIALMRYLARLITPEGGLILDPFAGSGTTGCAAVLEGFDFIGIEMIERYVEIARRRIAYWREQADREPAPLPLFPEIR